MTAKVKATEKEKKMRISKFTMALAILGIIGSSNASSTLNMVGDMVGDLLIKSLPKVSTSQNSSSGTYRGRVVSVSDGDTLTLLTEGNQQIKVRMQGIDAPEKAQPYGQASKRSLSEMAYKKNAVAECPEKDHYDRYVCKVSVDGVDINKAQIASGYAWVYRQHNNRRDYIEAESMAKSLRSGLWADSMPTPPWEYRRAERNN